MKNRIVLFGILLIMVCCAPPLMSVGLTRQPLRGIAQVEKVVFTGNYLITNANEGGLNIMDISDLTPPRIVSHYEDTDDNSYQLFLRGKYLINCSYDETEVLDVSDPLHPVSVAKTTVMRRVDGMVISGDILYATSRGLGIFIFDISDPTDIKQIGFLDDTAYMGRLALVGNHLYHGKGINGMQIIDVSDPTAPEIVGFRDKRSFHLFNVDDYLYVSNGVSTLFVLDVSDPLSPQQVGQLDFEKTIARGIMDDNYLYLRKEYGFYVIDLSSPTSPQLTGTFDEDFQLDQTKYNINIRGQHVFLSGISGMDIVSVAQPSAPVKIGQFFELPDFMVIRTRGDYAYVLESLIGFSIMDISNGPYTRALSYSFTPGTATDICLSGDYAFIADGQSGVIIFDISDPTAPVEVSRFIIPGNTYRVLTDGKTLYTLSTGAFRAFDVSVPADPAVLLEVPFSYPGDDYCMALSGQYAYVLGHDYFYIYDVSDPAAVFAVYQDTQFDATRVVVKDQYIYTINEQGDLDVLDAADITAPVPVGSCNLFSNKSDRIDIYGNYLYSSTYNHGLQYVDITDPTKPVRVDGLSIPGGYTSDFSIHGNHLYYVTGSYMFKYLFDDDMLPASLWVDRDALTFAGDTSGNVTAPQLLRITQSDGGPLSWTAVSDRSWLTVSPASGSGNRDVVVTADTSGLGAGSYTAQLTIASTTALNDPLSVSVQLTVSAGGQTAAPFGTFETPLQGSTVSSSVPVTGWVLDDVGVQSVKIYREDGDTLAYIGDAVMVEGARPDVEAAYPDYPNNNKAGWGYMMLTNFLPGGNGVFNIHAIAVDMEGNQTTLGVCTINVDNLNAVDPFGAIDTPTQGGTASGSDYINWGWALTPAPNAIPTDGSTITVWVNGIPVGQPTYNLYRKDIAELFPGYANSNGAVGSFILDTTQYANGVHNIAWSVVDDAGNRDGIGSRYFSISNSSQRSQTRAVSAATSTPKRRTQTVQLNDIPEARSSVIKAVNGFGCFNDSVPLTPVDGAPFILNSRELERVALYLDENIVEDHYLETENIPAPQTGTGLYTGYMVVGRHLKPLPIGSTLDSRNGVFYWQPGPGFVGSYHFVFIKGSGSSKQTKQMVTIKIRPKK